MNKITELNKKIRELKSDISIKQDEITIMFNQIQNLEDEKQKVCNHPKSKIRIQDNSWFEDGRMRAPLTWKEKVCGVCGKVVATTTKTVTEKWSDE